MWIIVCLVFAWLLSEQRGRTPWRLVVGGVALQFALALLLTVLGTSGAQPVVRGPTALTASGEFYDYVEARESLSGLFGGKGGIPNTIIGLFVLGVLNNGLDHVDKVIDTALGFAKQFGAELHLVHAVDVELERGRGHLALWVADERWAAGARGQVGIARSVDELPGPDRPAARLVLNDCRRHAAILRDRRDKASMEERTDRGLFADQLIQFDRFQLVCV